MTKAPATSAKKKTEPNPKKSLRNVWLHLDHIYEGLVSRLPKKDWPVVSSKISLGEFVRIAMSCTGKNKEERTKEACLWLWQSRFAWQTSFNQAVEAKAEFIDRNKKENARLKLLGFKPEELNAPIKHSVFLKKLNLREIDFKGKKYQGHDLWVLFLEEAMPWLKTQREQVQKHLKELETQRERIQKHRQEHAKNPVLKKEFLEQEREPAWEPSLAEYVAGIFRVWRKKLANNKRPKFQSGDQNPRSKKFQKKS
ncbi:MAG: hypothetical protein WCD79_00240 [Chthoniobacteraceae bacterium]